MIKSILEILINDKWLAIVPAAATFIIPIIMYSISKNKKIKTNVEMKTTEKIGTFVISSIGFIIVVASAIVSYQYTIVPEIKYMVSDFAIEKLNESSLKFNLGDLLHNNSDLIVYSYTPKAGEIVKKNTVVDIVMLNRNNPKFFTDTVSENRYVNDSNKGKIDALSTFNTNTIDLYLSDVGVKLNTKDDKYSRTLGQLNISDALIQLIDYETDKVVQEQISDQSGYIKFTEIPNGIYIFRIVREGYATQISQTPFKLEYNPNYEKDTLSWSINLLDNNSKFARQLFQIKIINENGEPLIGKKFEVRAIKNENNRDSYTSVAVYTNKNGIISLWHSIESGGVKTDYYDEVMFELASDYSIDIYDEKGNYINVNGSENKKIYELKF